MPGGCALGQGPMGLVPDTTGRHDSIVAGWHRGIQAVSGLLCCSRGHAQRQGKPKGAGPGKAPGPAPWWCTSVLMALCFNHHACAGHGVLGEPCVLNGPFRADFRACFGPFSTHGLTNVQNGPFHMPRTLVKTQVGPPLGLSRRRAEGRACISGPGTPNRNRRPAEGAQSVGSFRSADTGLPAGPHFA